MVRWVLRLLPWFALGSLALALRLDQVARIDLWMDEGFTWLRATNEHLWQAIVGWEGGYANKSHPPVSRLLVRLSVWVSGSDAPLFLRLPSILAGTATTLLLVGLTRRLGWSWAVAWGVGLVFALNPAAVDVSQWARHYGPMMLFAVLATWAWLRMLARPTWGRIVTYGALGGLMMLTYYFSFFVLFLHGLMTLIGRRWFDPEATTGTDDAEQPADGREAAQATRSPQAADESVSSPAGAKEEAARADQAGLIAVLIERLPNWLPRPFRGRWGEQLVAHGVGLVIAGLLFLPWFGFMLLDFPDQETAHLRTQTGLEDARDWLGANLTGARFGHPIGWQQGPSWDWKGTWHGQPLDVALTIGTFVPIALAAIAAGAYRRRWLLVCLGLGSAPVFLVTAGLKLRLLDYWHFSPFLPFFCGAVGLGLVALLGLPLRSGAARDVGTAHKSSGVARWGVVVLIGLPTTLCWAWLTLSGLSHQHGWGVSETHGIDPFGQQIADATPMPRDPWRELAAWGEPFVAFRSAPGSSSSSSSSAATAPTQSRLGSPENAPASAPLDGDSSSARTAAVLLYPNYFRGGLAAVIQDRPIYGIWPGIDPSWIDLQQAEHYDDRERFDLEVWPRLDRLRPTRLLVVTDLPFRIESDPTWAELRAWLAARGYELKDQRNAVGRHRAVTGRLFERALSDLWPDGG